MRQLHRLVVPVLGVVAALVIAACASPTPTPSATRQGVTRVVAHVRGIT